jgi:hypothetical protein
MERQDDMQISTLSRLVESLGRAVGIDCAHAEGGGADYAVWIGT